MRFLFSGVPFLVVAAAGASTPLVVIDPGHGGADEGATLYGRAIREKDITLAVAQRVAYFLHQSGIKARLTRDTDTELPVIERTALANRLRADLFVSLHVNSSTHPEARGGVETYVLQREHPRRPARLAELQRAVLSGSVANQAAAQAGPSGWAPVSNVSLIVKDLLLEGNYPHSRGLACAIQSALVDTVGASKDRGVRSALFYVLMGADMPSALVELGFLNQVADRQMLQSPSGRDQLAQSVARGIARSLAQEPCQNPRHLLVRSTPERAQHPERMAAHDARQH